MAGSVFICADTHIDHKRICEYRPQFKTVKEHNECIMDNLMSKLNKRTKLFILGDAAFTLRGHEMLGKLPGFIHLIAGNHCTERGGCNMRELARIYDRVDAAFSYGTGKNKFWLTHIPIHPMELRGKRNIHGHMHGKIIPDSNYINVSLEQINYMPLDIEEILNGNYRTFDVLS